MQIETEFEPDFRKLPLRETYEISYAPQTQWLKVDPPWYPAITLSDEEWIAERVSHGLRMMRHSVEISPDVRSGVPVLRDTRMPLSRILAEISDSEFLDQFAVEWELDASHLREFLDGLSIQLDRPFAR